MAVAMAAREALFRVADWSESRRAVLRSTATSRTLARCADLAACRPVFREAARENPKIANPPKRRACISGEPGKIISLAVMILPEFAEHRKRDSRHRCFASEISRFPAGALHPGGKLCSQSSL